LKSLRNLTIYYGENEKDRIFEHSKQFFSSDLPNKCREYKIVVDSPLWETPQIYSLIHTVKQYIRGGINLLPVTIGIDCIMSVSEAIEINDMLCNEGVEKEKIILKLTGVELKMIEINNLVTQNKV
jgi:hypothetical protein